MYRAPQNELRFLIHRLRREYSATADDGFTPELIDSVLEEAARFAADVLEPLNRSGDIEGAQLRADGVRTPTGFAAAYRQFVDAGWPQLSGEPAYGGQGAPMVLQCAVQEMWASANLAFKLCPMLTHAAAEALRLCGSDEQKRLYLPKLVSGEWTGTMALTEAHAGSDLALVRTRAVPRDGNYLLFGQKIFITWGDHECAPNIVHLVLARIEGAPPGVKGLSLFIVPKFLVAAGGELGARNDVHCVSIEQKLGLHASPTCVLSFGDRGGASAYLVGEANRGLEYMFVMMNAARLAVGIEGYALSERAYQRAVEWATRRLQGKSSREAGAAAVPIIQHADVRRMLLMMKSGTEAMRALSLYTAMHLDLARNGGAAAMSAASRAELLTPIVKGWCTELGNELTAVGVQVHGGAGYIEETGAAQHIRDARIVTIYEGTTGIQAIDLVRRKLQRDEGAAMFGLIEEMQNDMKAHAGAYLPTMASVHATITLSVARLADTTRTLVRMLRSEPESALAVAEPYLRLCGYTISAWLMTRFCRPAGEVHRGEFADRKAQTTLFYAKHILPRAAALAEVIGEGAECVTSVTAEHFS